MALYPDAPGPDKVTRADLKVETSRPNLATINNPLRRSYADWITPEGMADLLRSADSNNPEGYFILAAEMQERDPHISSLLNTRTLSVSGSPVQVVPASQDAKDIAIAEALEDVTESPEFKSLVSGLMSAVWYGFSACEIIWDLTGKLWKPKKYVWREPRFFVLDRNTMTEPRIRTMAQPAFGEALAPNKWVVHIPKNRPGNITRAGLARTAAGTWAAKRFTLGDLTTFLNRFGMPLRVGRYEPNATPEQQTEFLHQLTRVGSDSACVLPKDFTLEFIEVNASGNSEVYLATIDFLNKELSKLLLGQTMTSEDGASLAQSQTHEKVRQDIRRDDASAVADAINEWLVKAFVDLNFGPQEVYPRVLIDVSEPEDGAKLVAVATQAVALGIEIQASELRARLGFAEPEPGAELCRMPAAPASSEPDGDEADDGEEEKPEPTEEEPTEDDDEEDSSKEMNREHYAAVAPTDDLLSRYEEQHFDWQAVQDETVQVLAQKLANSMNHDEAKTLLTALAHDKGDVISVAAMVRALATSGLFAAVLGDTTDATQAADMLKEKR